MWFRRILVTFAASLLIGVAGIAYAYLRFERPVNFQSAVIIALLTVIMTLMFIVVIGIKISRYIEDGCQGDES